MLQYVTLKEKLSEPNRVKKRKGDEFLIATFMLTAISLSANKWKGYRTNLNKVHF